jgi:hypothetical protein
LTIQAYGERSGISLLLPLVDAIAPIRGVRGRQLQRPRLSMPIAATIPVPTIRNCAHAVSSRSSQSVVVNTAAGSEDFAGSFNGLTPGSTTFVVFVSASSVVLPFLKRS